MKIDMYTHILTPKYWDAVKDHASFHMKELGALWDIEKRFEVMDKFEDYAQVLTFSIPPLEAVTDPARAADLAKSSNDELAEILHRYPDRFVAGVANLPMNNVDAAIKEAERAIKDLGLKGIQLYSNINGKPLDSPEFWPLYAILAEHDVPLWIHPRRDEDVADYATESRSEFRIHGSIGWPFETQVAMTRLVCNGVMEKYPNLKVITHHCGGGLPFLVNRIASWLRVYMEDPKSPISKFTREPKEQLRQFYGDTAINSTSALECGCDFFGAGHIVFASDMPYGRRQGEDSIRGAIKTISEMDISDAEKQLIFEDNARKILNLD